MYDKQTNKKSKTKTKEPAEYLLVKMSFCEAVKKLVFCRSDLMLPEIYQTKSLGMRDIEKSSMRANIYFDSNNPTVM